MRKVGEWISVNIAKAPGLMVLLGILLANIVFFSISAIIISQLAPSYLEHTGFWSCVFYTVTMILDAGCIEFVISDVGQAGVALILTCIVTIIIGMIVFTGAVIGYMTNWISNFIESANSGSRKLRVSNHVVILNWNTRASEIVNDLIYKGSKETVVVLAGNNRNDIVREIDERILGTLESERKSLIESSAHMGNSERRRYVKKHSVKNKLTVIVREGEPYSTKQLNDISIKLARSIIILGHDSASTQRRYVDRNKFSRIEKGNAHTIKTLVQVAQITAAEDSANDQQVIVEVEDEWTLTLINNIIEHKMRKGKCNIVPVAVNKILGQIFSQFAIMPELNTVYNTLFSNKGAAFYVQSDISLPRSEEDFVTEFLSNHSKSIPLTIMRDSDDKIHCYYMSDNEAHINSHEQILASKDLHMEINHDYEMKDKNVIILGHNSKCGAIMEGFNSFRGEWQKKGRPEVLNIIVIDDEKNLQKQDYYKKFPYVKGVVEADIYDKATICGAIEDFIDLNGGNTSLLILSDDSASNEDTDSASLTYLIYIQDIINKRLAADPEYDASSIDVVVEILNPKNYDVAYHYCANNIVISNRYISKMVTQIGEKEALFDFYKDILTYDIQDTVVFISKELYIKKASEFFNEIPAPCNAADFIRAVYNNSPEENKSIALGFISHDGRMVLFDGNQAEIQVSLTDSDKVILFSNH